MFRIFGGRAERTRLFQGAYRSQAQVDIALMRIALRDLGVCDVERVGERDLRVTLYSCVEWTEELAEQIAAEFAA
jgi:hypothetical protein